MSNITYDDVIAWLNNNEDIDQVDGAMRLSSTRYNQLRSKGKKRKQKLEVRYKTSGTNWLRHSMVSFNGSGYADKTSPMHYIASYEAYKTLRKDNRALKILAEYHEDSVLYAQEMMGSNDASKEPTEKNMAKFMQVYAPYLDKLSDLNHNSSYGIIH